MQIWDKRGGKKSPLDVFENLVSKSVRRFVYPKEMREACRKYQGQEWPDTYRPGAMVEALQENDREALRKLESEHLGSCSGFHAVAYAEYAYFLSSRIRPSERRTTMREW